MMTRKKKSITGPVHLITSALEQRRESLHLKKTVKIFVLNQNQRQLTTLITTIILSLCRIITLTEGYIDRFIEDLIDRVKLLFKLLFKLRVKLLVKLLVKLNLVRDLSESDKLISDII
jgi:hypothetical protein